MVDFHKQILLSDEAHFWLNGYVNKQNCRIWSEANPQVYIETPLHPEKLTVWCALWAGGIIGPYFFKNDEGHNVTVNARATIDLLKGTFGGRLISRFGPVNWPPRSCDLTPLDYFLWGYAKSLVYADKPQTLDHLEDNIRLVIADIRPQMLEKVIENWTSRLDYIRESLRLYPSVPFIGRECYEPFRVLDHTVPSGSFCIILICELHLDPESFPEPEKFIPERFFPENSVGRHPYAFIPFSAGPRNCLAKSKSPGLYAVFFFLYVWKTIIKFPFTSKHHTGIPEVSCKELLPAPGNRSNKRRDREEDLATTEEKRSERGRRERVTEKKPGW
ncbi:cytochrome P450 4V2 [Trichonephila clavipes]|nr:cytochrome P450 4V2 [Trichonephila clavipes]